MYRLHGFFTQNTLKTLYVLEEIGADYEFCFVDLGKRTLGLVMAFGSFL